MKRSIKKRAIGLSIAAILTVSSCFAAGNKILNIEFETTPAGVVATVVTTKETTGAFRAVKSGQYYNIILPNVDRGSLSKLAPGGQVESVRISTVPSSTGGGSYTKIQIKAVPGVVVLAKSMVAPPDVQIETVAEDTTHNISPEKHGEGHEAYEEERFEEESYDEEFVEEETPSAPPVVETTPEEQEFEEVAPASSIKRDHTAEILNILIGSVVLLLVIVLLYINGRDRMKQLCGDMGVDLDDDEEKAKKEKLKQAKKEEQEQKKREKEEKKRIAKEQRELLRQQKAEQRAAALAAAELAKQQSQAVPSEDEEDEPKTVIDIDAIYATDDSKPTQAEPPKEEPVAEEETSADDEYDLDDFLSSWADDDEEEEQSEDKEQPKEEPAAETPSQPEEYEETTDDENAENPLDNLIDDVIATQGISFSESDMEAIQKKLQADVSNELMEELKFAQPEQQTVIEPVTVEEFDKKYPALSDAVIDKIIATQGVKFNEIDRKVVYELMTSFEMAEDALIDARVRKAKEDEENISYYESEQDFAFTLVKTDDVTNANDMVVVDGNMYPDIENVDFSGDAILEEFSLIAPEPVINAAEISDAAPSLDDIEAAMNNLKLGGNVSPEDEKAYTKPEPEIDTTSGDDSILSEFSLIKPEVKNVKGDDAFSSTVFTSMDDIEEQFKALGVDFEVDDDKKSEPTQATPVEVKEETIQPEPVEVPVSEGFEFDEAEILAKHSIDFSTEFYVAKYDTKTMLIGMKNGVIKPLHEFEQGFEPSKLTAREAEETENGRRYIVRADKSKFVVEVTDNDIKLVIVL